MNKFNRNSVKKRLKRFLSFNDSGSSTECDNKMSQSFDALLSSPAQNDGVLSSPARNGARLRMTQSFTAGDSVSA